MLEGGLPMLSSASVKGLHVGDLPYHQELQRIFSAGIAAEINEPPIDNLRPSLGGDVAAKVHLEISAVQAFPCELNKFTPPTCHHNQRVGFCRFSH
jgi:hypothetical protein